MPIYPQPPPITKKIHGHGGGSGAALALKITLDQINISYSENTLTIGNQNFTINNGSSINGGKAIFNGDVLPQGFETLDKNYKLGIKNGNSGNSNNGSGGKSLLADLKLPPHLPYLPGTIFGSGGQGGYGVDKKGHGNLGKVGQPPILYYLYEKKPEPEPEPEPFTPKDRDDLVNAIKNSKNGVYKGSHIKDWNVSKITDMHSLIMPYVAKSFNYEIGNWNVSNVTNMQSMFEGASKFDQDISKWNVNKVTDMSYMFSAAVSFNQNISTKDISAEESQTKEAYKAWDVSKVTSMESMFTSASLFNGDIGNWNVSNVTNMNGMFYAASAFNQKLTSWNVKNITSEPQFFSTNSNLIPENEPKWGSGPET